MGGFDSGSVFFLLRVDKELGFQLPDNQYDKAILLILGESKGRIEMDYLAKEKIDSAARGSEQHKIRLDGGYQRPVILFCNLPEGYETKHSPRYYEHWLRLKHINPSSSGRETFTFITSHLRPVFSNTYLR